MGQRRPTWARPTEAAEAAFSQSFPLYGLGGRRVWVVAVAPLVGRRRGQHRSRLKVLPRSDQGGGGTGVPARETKGADSAFGNLYGLQGPYLDIPKGS